MKKIIIIEDDKGIATSLGLYLENSGFEVDTHETGQGAVEKILASLPDLVILDINLPFKSGISICKELRNNKIYTPVIFLTARDSEESVIEGLEVGGDDYISKPFSPREVKARIDSIFRRQETKEASKKMLKNHDIFGQFQFISDSEEVIFNGETIEFTQNEFDIFREIASKNGSVVTRESLMHKVIGYDNYLYDRTLDTHIKNIRKKIGNKEAVETIRSKGFRLGEDFRY